jgi:hypothetical protein
LGSFETPYTFRSCVGFCLALIEMQFSVGICPIKLQNIKIKTNKFKLGQYGVSYVQKKKMMSLV